MAYVLFVELGLAGYLEIVQLLFSRASGPECVKRMIETADIEGDTVSILHLQMPQSLSPSIL